MAQLSGIRSGRIASFCHINIGVSVSSLSTGRKAALYLCTMGGYANNCHLFYWRCGVPCHFSMLTTLVRKVLKCVQFFTRWSLSWPVILTKFSLLRICTASNGMPFTCFVRNCCNMVYHYYIFILKIIKCMFEVINAVLVVGSCVFVLPAIFKTFN